MSAEIDAIIALYRELLTGEKPLDTIPSVRYDQGMDIKTEERKGNAMADRQAQVEKAAGLVSSNICGEGTASEWVANIRSAMDEVGLPTGAEAEVAQACFMDWPTLLADRKAGR